MSRLPQKQYYCPASLERMTYLEKVFHVQTSLQPCVPSACNTFFKVSFALYRSRGLINSVLYIGEKFIIIHKKYFLKLSWKKKGSGGKQSVTVIQWGGVKEIRIRISKTHVETPKSEAVRQRCFYEKVFWENVTSLQGCKLFAILLKSHFHMGVPL